MDASTLFYAYEKAKEEMRVSVMAMVASGNRDSRELATHNRYARLAGKLAKRITTPQGAAEKERDELRRQLEEARRLLGAWVALTHTTPVTQYDMDLRKRTEQYLKA
jgi:hypothetical protein